MSPVSAALDIIDTDGYQALSVRRLARTLNYSRSGAAYRIGSMGALDRAVRSVILEDLASAMLGPAPHRPDERSWHEGSAARTLDWIDRFPNRAVYVASTRPTTDAACAVVGAELPALLGELAGFELSANYMVGVFKLAYEIARAFDDRSYAIQACASHFQTSWATIQAAAHNDTSLLVG